MQINQNRNADSQPGSDHASIQSSPKLQPKRDSKNTSSCWDCFRELSCFGGGSTKKEAIFPVKAVITESNWFDRTKINREEIAEIRPALNVARTSDLQVASDEQRTALVKNLALQKIHNAADGIRFFDLAKHISSKLTHDDIAFVARKLNEDGGNTLKFFANLPSFLGNHRTAIHVAGQENRALTREDTKIMKFHEGLSTSHGQDLLIAPETDVAKIILKDPELLDRVTKYREITEDVDLGGDSSRIGTAICATPAAAILQKNAICSAFYHLYAEDASLSREDFAQLQWLFPGVERELPPAAISLE